MASPHRAEGDPPRARSERGRRAPTPYGPYLLLERIDQGGMAEVFRAVRRGPEGFVRTFALKRIAPQLAGSPDFVAMFCAEARISALLNHPNIVQVYDFGEAGRTYYLAMELLKGHSVRAVLRALARRTSALPIPLAVHVARQVAIGLAYAHALRGPDRTPLDLVHRDVTPSNVMLLRSGGVKILDFGIAKASAVSQLKTQAGLVKGKLAYASPEQLACKPLDGRSDVFSLGITLWEMLAQRRLFAAATDFETVRKVLHEPIPPPSSVRPEVPAELDEIVLGALARDPERRPDARQLGAALRGLLRSQDDLAEALAELFADLFGDPATSSITLPGPAEPGDAAAPEAATQIIGGTTLNALLDGAPAGGGGERERATAPGAEVPPPEIPSASADAPGEEPSAAPAAIEPQGAPAPAAPPRPRRRIALAVAAAAVAAAVLALNARAARHLLQLLGDAASPPPSATAPSGTTIALELHTNPSGAVIELDPGRVLGRTPAVVRLQRGLVPVTLTLRKPGHEPLRYRLTPERDALAALDLRPARSERDDSRHTKAQEATSHEPDESHGQAPAEGLPRR